MSHASILGRCGLGSPPSRKSKTIRPCDSRSPRVWQCLALPQAASARYPPSVIDPDLLAILVCPESRQPLAEADQNLLAALNEKIAAGGMKTVAGADVTESLEAALVREDGKLAYAVRQGIPVLLPEEGLPV